MSGSDQSKNLTGMLSQIGTQLGTGYQDVGEQLAGNITRVGMPKLDTSDPDSIQSYVDWGLGSGELTPAQASQYGWMKQQAEKTARAETSRSLVQNFNNREQALGTLQQRLAAAEESGNQQMAANIARSMEIVQASRDEIDRQIQADPDATKARDAELRANYERQRIQDAMVAREAAQRELVEQEQFDKMSNGFTGALVTGQLNPETDDGKAVLEQLKQQKPAVYEDVIKRTTDILKREQEMKAAAGDLSNEMLDESFFEGFPPGTYDRYKDAYAAQPRIANQNAIAGRKQIDVAAVSAGKDTDPERPKGLGYDLSTASGRQEAQSIAATYINELAQSNETLKRLVSQNSSGNTNGARLMAGRIMTEMEAKGLDITASSIAAFIQEEYAAAEKDETSSSWKLFSPSTWFGGDEEAEAAPAKKSADEYM